MQKLSLPMQKFWRLCYEVLKILLKLNSLTKINFWQRGKIANAAKSTFCSLERLDHWHKKVSNQNSDLLQFLTKISWPPWVREMLYHFLKVWIVVIKVWNEIFVAWSLSMQSPFEWKDIKFRKISLALPRAMFFPVSFKNLILRFQTFQKRYQINIYELIWFVRVRVTCKCSWKPLIVAKSNW